MSLTTIATSFLEIVNRGDTAAFLDLFTEDGGLEDLGSIFVGRNEVKAWCDRKLNGDRRKLELVSLEELGDVVTMLVKSQGDYSRMFTRMSITVSGNRIDELRIS
jgi:hypothetical protein